MVVKAVAAAVGGVVTAVVSALCCVGPLVAVSLGLSGAGFATTFEPLRPWLLGGTGLLLGTGFVLVRREDRNACEPGRPCAAPHVRRRMRVMLWVATAVALVLALYPTWSAWFLRRS